MDFTRILKRYMRGDDVWAVKQKLLELKYLVKATHNKYGDDTYRAVKLFQKANNLTQDGIVDETTWNKLFGTSPDPGPTPSIVIPSWIGKTAANAIAAELAGVSQIRRDICLEALNWTIDPSCPTETLKGFYIRGANAYDKDLTPHIMTKSRLDAYFKKTAYEPYYDGGRKEMMLAQSEKDGYDKIGADCSGSIVGWWRKFKVVGSGFDANANSLYSRYCTATSSPIPGDLAWRNGHIGLYVGGNYVVEFAGGAYGCQLTYTKKRRVYNYITKKLQSMSAWTAFGDPKCY